MFIGIDIGGTNIKYGVIDNSGNVLTQNSFKNDNNLSLNVILDNIQSAIFLMIEQFPAVQSIGVGIPGIIDNSGALIVSPNLPNWIGINIEHELKKYFNLKIAVDNDSNAAAIAELELGNGNDLDHFLYITLGTGIGGTIIINKQIYKGAFGGAGEIGHTIINYDKINKKIPSYRQGILEEFAGKNGIIENYKSRLNHSEIPNYYNAINYDVKEIADAAKSGSNPAIDCLKDIGEIIGIGLASAMNLLDIPYAIIGGGISQVGEIIFDSIKNTIRERSLPTISNKFEVREAYFKQNTGLIGAAMLGAHKLKVRNS